MFSKLESKKYLLSELLELWDLSTVVKSSISFSHLFASFFNKLPNQTIKQLQSIYRLHSLNLHFKWIWSIYSLSHTHTHMCARFHTIYSCQFSSVQLRGIEQYIDTHTHVMEYVRCEFALDKSATIFNSLLNFPLFLFQFRIWCEQLKVI